jgi:hypothetical protein
MADGDESDRIKRGAAAWLRVQNRESWQDWAQICDALAILRTRALLLAKTNSIRAKGIGCISPHC